MDNLFKWKDNRMYGRTTLFRMPVRGGLLPFLGFSNELIDIETGGYLPSLIVEQLLELEEKCGSFKEAAEKTPYIWPGGTADQEEVYACSFNNFPVRFAKRKVFLVEWLGVSVICSPTEE